MFGRQIFRKTSLEKLTTPEDLDELLQVNSSQSWLLLAGVTVTLAGMLLWGVFGTIALEVNGTGIIKTRDLPREVVANCTGQVDSIFCRPGDRVARDQKLMKIFLVEDASYADLFSPYSGEITGLNVREGAYVRIGSPVLDMTRTHDSVAAAPEVVFFVADKEILKLKAGMSVDLDVENSGVPRGTVKGAISYIGSFPATRSAVQKYFSDEARIARLLASDVHEVRALLAAGADPGSENTFLQSLNGLTCEATVTVARRSPIAFFLH